MAIDFARKDVLFVGIHSDQLETAEEIRVHARKHEHAFPMIPDADAEVARLFEARRTPEAFLLDREGKLRYRGRIAAKIGTPDLRNALHALLAGRKIQPEETKAFGCAIRWSRART
jgi:alkyl hydroperoxide reductase subunit AhpC